jgi:hypothetical protein
MRRLLAADNPLGFIRSKPVKLISVPHTGSTVALRFTFILRPFILVALALATSDFKEYSLVYAFLSFLTTVGRGLLINPVEIDGRQKPAVEVALWQQLLEAHAVEHFWCKCFSSLHDSHLRIAFALFNYFY